MWSILTLTVTIVDLDPDGINCFEAQMTEKNTFIQ